MKEEEGVTLRGRAQDGLFQLSRKNSGTRLVYVVSHSKVAIAFLFVFSLDCSLDCSRIFLGFFSDFFRIFLGFFSDGVFASRGYRGVESIFVPAVVPFGSV